MAGNIDIDEGYIADECREQPPLSLVDVQDDAIVLAEPFDHYRSLMMTLFGCLVAAGVIAYAGWLGYDFVRSGSTPTLTIIGYLMCFAVVLMLPTILFLAFGIVGECICRPLVRFAADGWSNEFRWFGMQYGESGRFGENAVVVVLKARARTDDIAIAIYPDDQDKQVVKIYEGPLGPASSKLADDCSRILKRPIRTLS